MKQIVVLKFVISTNFGFWKYFIILKWVKLYFSKKVQSIEFLMDYLPIYLDVIFSLVREKKKKNTCFRKLRRDLGVLRIILGVKVLYHIQSVHFSNKVCTRDHGLSFKKNWFSTIILRWDTEETKLMQNFCTTRYDDVMLIKEKGIKKSVVDDGGYFFSNLHNIISKNFVRLLWKCSVNTARNQIQTLI
jgi:hypothetical protein